MKKISVLLGLLILLGFGLSSAQQMQVADLQGDYVCTSVGVPASLEFFVNGAEVELYFCPDVANDCISYIELFPTLVDGQIKRKGAEPGDPPADWPDVRFVVAQNQGQVTITAFYANGIEYEFERQ